MKKVKPEKMPAIKKNILKQIKVFVMDVDGVLTDGKIVFLASGEEVKSWNVKDRIAFFILKRLGFPVCWISGRSCAEVEKTALYLGVSGVYLGVKDKLDVWEKIKKKFGVTDEEILYIGDDLVDAVLLQRAGFSACPADAAPEVVKICDYRTKAAGGGGVLREVAECALKARGEWKKVLKYYGI